MEIIVNGERRSTTEDQTVAGLVRDLDLPSGGIAVIVGGDLVPGDRHAQTPLYEGDAVEIVTMVGGG